MNVFYIELITKAHELSMFTDFTNLEGRVKHSRQIRCEGVALYPDNGYQLADNEKHLAMPNHVSVFLMDNSEQESNKKCRYFEEVIDEDSNELISESSFEIAIDYPDDKFETLWRMFSELQNGYVKIRVCVIAPDMSSYNIRKIIKVVEGNVWQLGYCSIDRVLEE